MTSLLKRVGPKISPRRLCSRWGRCLPGDRVQCRCDCTDFRVVGTVQSVASCNKSGVIVRQARYAGLVLPHQSLQWQIDAQSLSCLHQWCAGLGIAKDQEFRRPQRQSDCSCARSVVNMGVDGQSPCPNLGLEPVHRFLRSISAFDRDQPICGHSLASRTVRDAPTLSPVDAPILETVLKSSELASSIGHRFWCETVQMALKFPKGAPMPGHDQRPVYRYGAWEIDLARREMRLKDVPTDVGSRAFEIVEILVQSSGKLVDKYDLMTRVWPGAVV